MRTKMYKGQVFLYDAPTDEDATFCQLVYAVASTASYHAGHRRWTFGLSTAVVTGLRAMGVTMPQDIDDWQTEQNRLESQRREANRFKSMDAEEVRRRLQAAGIRFREEGGRRLMAHQVIGVAYALRLPACGLFLDTGTGKTAVAATVMQALHDLKGLGRFLVIAPKTLLNVGWADDIRRFSWLSAVNINAPPARAAARACPVCNRSFKGHVSWAHMRTHMSGFIARNGEEAAQSALYAKYPHLRPVGREREPVTTCPICGLKTRGHVSWSHLKTHAHFHDRKTEARARSEMYDRYPDIAPLAVDTRRERLLRVLDDTSHQVFLINPESFKLVIDDLQTRNWDLVIVDESSMLKSPRSAITKKMIDFGSVVRRRLCMTGTPRPNSSLDLWGQMAFLDQSLGGSFTKFRDEWFALGYDGYTWKPKSPVVDHRIWDIVAERSYRVKLEDCIDLPGETIERLGVRLTGRLDAHYQDMLKKMIVQLDSGQEVSTSWQIVQMNKLAQITSGYIFDDQGVAQFLDDSPKITATIDMARRLVADEDRSVVIWVRFPKTEGDRIEEALSSFGVSTLHGHTRDAEASIRAFIDGRHRVMIAHPLSAKFGHTWVNSNVAIFHSYDYSWENFYQAKRRIYRQGQTSPVTYVVNVALDTVDEEILDRVFAKERASDEVVDENLLTAVARRQQDCHRS